MGRSPTLEREVRHQTELIIDLESTKGHQELLEKKEGGGGDGRVDEEEENDGGGDGPIAESGSVPRVEDGPHSETEEDEKERKGDVNQEVEVGRGSEAKSEIIGGLQEESRKQPKERTLDPTVAAGSVEWRKSWMRRGQESSKETVRKTRWRWLVRILK